MGRITLSIAYITPLFACISVDISPNSEKLFAAKNCPKAKFVSERTVNEPSLDKTPAKSAAKIASTKILVSSTAIAKSTTVGRPIICLILKYSYRLKIDLRCF